MLGKLVARDTELASFDDALDSARAGTGTVLVVSVPPGGGKTALLDALGAAAADATVRHATGAELERSLTYGVVRQLFGRDANRPELPESIVRLFGGVPSDVAPDPTTVCFAVEHLVGELGADAAVVVTVDDAQWADTGSLEVLAFLARRVASLPLVLAIGVSPTADTPAALQAIEAVPHARILRPAPLDAAATAEVVATLLGATPDSAFVDACLSATGGVPLYLVELCRSLHPDPTTPAQFKPSDVERARPEAIRRAVLTRLARTSNDAQRVAAAVAVLGDGAEPRHVAAMTELDASSVARAIDELAAADVFAPGVPAQFARSVLRVVVYDELPDAARADAHGQAANVLLEDAADPERVAAHILRAPVTRSQRRVVALETAAAVAQQRGGNAAAVAYLERALLEAPTGLDTAPLLVQLGRAQLFDADERALATLEKAAAAADDTATRGRAISALANAHAIAGRHHVAVDLLAELTESAPDEADTLQDLAAALVGYASAAGPDAIARVAPIVEPVAQRATPDTPGGRRLLAVRGATRAQAGAPLESWLPDVERYLDDVGNQPSRETFRIYAVIALTRYGLFDLAHSILEHWLGRAADEGSPYELIHATSAAANIAYTRGDMLATEAYAAEAHELWRHTGWVTPLGSGGLILALLEQGRIDDAKGVLDEVLPLLGDAPATRSLGMLAGARGRYRLATGDVDGALADLVPLYEASNSGLWRSYAMEALLAAGRDADARRLAEEGVARSQDEPPLLQALARRELALVTPGDEGIDALAQARNDLAGSGMQFELCRAALFHGMALRRARRPTHARVPLAEALELANACGAWAVEERARGELVAAGARPRRAARSGLASLTATERRVATLAASGQSNPEIARTLFVSRKSVETHLSHVYQKLGIRGRAELPDSLAAP